MRQLIAGNWKMNGTGAALAELAALKAMLAATPSACDILVCPPASLIARASATVQDAFALGGQDCHPQACGPFTGDISAEMLRDGGASAVIVGHSERRQHYGESDALVVAKAQAAWRAGLTAIICIGETQAQRAGGTAQTVCRTQIAGSVPPGATPANTVLAYEPVWAIGTGHTPSGAEITLTHAHLRSCLVATCGGAGAMVRILYGGSVNPANASAILGLPEVGGALVGGASLKAADFLAIIDAARKS